MPGVRLAVVCLLAMITPLAATSTVSAQRGDTFEIRRPPNAAAPPIISDPEEVAFGDVMPGSSNTMTVQLLNTGDEPLVVTAVRTSCNCTTTELPTKVIQPGQIVPMQAKLDADDYMGRMRRNIAIFCEGYSQPKQIFVTCWVNYGVQVIARYDPPGQFRTGELELKDIEGRPFRVLSANGQAPEFVDGFDPSTDEPKNQYRIAIDFEGMSPEELPKWFLVELDHPTAPIVDVRVMGRPEERRMRPWQVSDERILLWRMEPGSSKDITVTLRQIMGDPLNALDDLAATNPDVDVRLMGMSITGDGTVLRLRVSPKEGYRGVLLTTVELTARGHTETVDLIGRVAPESD